MRRARSGGSDLQNVLSTDWTSRRFLGFICR